MLEQKQKNTCGDFLVPDTKIAASIIFLTTVLN